MAVKTVKKDDDKPSTSVTFIGKADQSNDTKFVVQDTLTYEDEYQSLYWSTDHPDNLLIEPPFNLKVLKGLVTKNNILSQCVEAMEVNVDGTGWTIEPAVLDDNKEQDDNYHMLKAFFSEPYPGIGFTTLRRKLRDDLESTGNGYMEVLRAVNGDIVYLRYLDSTLMRLVKLDEPVPVEQAIVRNGKEVKAKVLTRERRYAQKIGERIIYFAEFGASRQLHRTEGSWAEGKKKLPANDRATEVIHFTVQKDVRTAYGIPRWINQLPSVIGSRKAEEFNLDFFDAGGVPPATIFLEGGALAEDVREQLEAHFTKATGKHRVAVVSVQSTSGGMKEASNVRVSVERFGDSGKSDAMFQNYDKNAEEHVRVGFRLPPLFVGRAQDYNFATAMTGYMVTEAQVFAPERAEFDEIINMRLVRALGIKDWVFRSKPLTLKNVDVQLKAIGIVKDKIDPEHMVESVNDIAGLNLKYSEEHSELLGKVKEYQRQLNQQQMTPTPNNAPGGPKGNGVENPTTGTPQQEKPTAEPTRKAHQLLSPDLIWRLVQDWMVVEGLEENRQDIGEEGLSMDAVSAEEVRNRVRKLHPEERELFDTLVAHKTFNGDSSPDLREILSCCNSME